MVYYKSKKHHLASLKPLSAVLQDITEDDISSILGVQSIQNLRKDFIIWLRCTEDVDTYEEAGFNHVIKKGEFSGQVLPSRNPSLFSSHLLWHHQDHSQVQSALGFP